MLVTIDKSYLKEIIAHMQLNEGRKKLIYQAIEASKQPQPEELENIKLQFCEESCQGAEVCKSKDTCDGSGFCSIMDLANEAYQLGQQSKPVLAEQVEAEVSLCSVCMHGDNYSASCITQEDNPQECNINERANKLVTAAKQEQAARIESLLKTANELNERTKELEEQKAARIAELENHLDLMVDEFYRIKAITDNAEIFELCDRAVTNIKQKVDVIQQRDNALSRIAELEAQIEAQKNIISVMWKQYESTRKDKK